VIDVIRAMREADPEHAPEGRYSIGLDASGGRVDAPFRLGPEPTIYFDLPGTWQARRAALSVLGVRVVVNPVASGKER
jgi:hypothetical protein